MRSRSLVSGVVFVLSLAISSVAQTPAPGPAQRMPSKPIRPFVVLPSQSLGDVEKKLHPANKVEELIGGEGMELRVAVQHGNVEAEHLRLGGVVEQQLAGRE